MCIYLIKTIATIAFKTSDQNNGKVSKYQFDIVNIIINECLNNGYCH